MRKVRDSGHSRQVGRYSQVDGKLLLSQKSKKRRSKLPARRKSSKAISPCRSRDAGIAGSQLANSANPICKTLP